MLRCDVTLLRSLGHATASGENVVTERGVVSNHALERAERDVERSGHALDRSVLVIERQDPSPSCWRCECSELRGRYAVCCHAVAIDTSRAACQVLCMTIALDRMGGDNLCEWRALGCEGVAARRVVAAAGKIHPMPNGEALVSVWPGPFAVCTNCEIGVRMWLANPVFEDIA
mgnify:CR=1 FL=1